MSNAKYKTLAQEFIVKIDKSRVITDPTLCFTLGTDASLYRLVPQIIVKINSLDELVDILRLCSQFKAAYTFRAAGTSLSGQAVSDSVLIMLTENWNNYDILDKGKKIRLQSGVIGADANRYLLPFQKKIGPDPASINSCKIGGIAANNASGMCCGTTENSYQTLASMTVVLADGTVLNTADIISVQNFKKKHSKLSDKLSDLAFQTQQNQSLKQLIEHKYRLKNTMGFSINALVDFEDPIEILQHLMIGSEGCLGFIADITFNTVIESEHKATALLIYADIETACKAVSSLDNQDVAAAELIDGRALKSINGLDGVPDFINDLDLEATALLLECHASSKDELEHLTAQVMETLDNFPSVDSISFTDDTDVCSKLWLVRKGLFPAVGAMRRKGTSVIIEDINFPLEQLAAGTTALRSLMNKHGYDDAIIFGHALVGNLHFVITHDFSIENEVVQYEKFMEELSNLVAIDFKGSLKAEHGTGRNMAPFVEREWGSAAYKLMQQIKVLFDPDGLMNPGVVLNSDKQINIKDLKTLPIADELIDQCIECGFCESVCPSRDLSLTPRQRIVMFRQLQYLKNEKQTPAIKNQIQLLTKQFEYYGIETCVATGLCAEKCPVGINTGELILNLRKNNFALSSIFSKRVAKWTADNFKLFTSIIRVLFKVNNLLNKILPAKVINSIGQILHRWSFNKLPLWTAEYPTASNAAKQPTKVADKKIVYLPSCAGRSMGTQSEANDQRCLSDVSISLLEKAGYQVIIPNEMEQHCCGMLYNSHGMADIAEQKSKQLESRLWKMTESGKWPVLIDTSPCNKFSNDNFSHQMNIYDPSEFAAKYLIDELSIKPLKETVMLHVTCSSRRMKLTQMMIALANECADNVFIAENIDCCGWAGSKGFTTPELNESALSSLKNQLPDDCHRGFSNSITCEIGLSHHSGIPFQSILYLLDEVSTGKKG